MKKPTSARCQQGFSLIELLIAMTLTLIVAGIAATLLAQSFRMRSREDIRSDAIADAQRALNIVSREIANSGFGLIDNGLVAGDCNANTIRVRANLNRFDAAAPASARNGTTEPTWDSGEDVKFFVHPAATTTLLARYDPIRASIQRVLKLAEGSCAKADWARAMKHVAPWAEPAALAEASAPEMLTDIALFEPNQRGRRVFDRFLSDKASQRLSAPDFALAQRMAGAVFSIFRVAERHEAAGLWLEDMLRGDRRLWLVDRSFEARAPENPLIP